MLFYRITVEKSKHSSSQKMMYFQCSKTITYSRMHRIHYLHLQDISLISLNFETSLVNWSLEKRFKEL